MTYCQCRISARRDHWDESNDANDEAQQGHYQQTIGDKLKLYQKYIIGI